MRRTSIITISIMFAIIVGLTGALVYTNLPDAEETESETLQNNESQTDESSDEIVAETPTEVPLDSDIVADMYNMLNGKTVYQSRNILHYTNKGILTADNLTDEDIQTIAFFYEAYNYIEDYSLTSTEERTITTEEMDSAVKHVFGDIEYNHTYVYVYNTDSKVLEYDQERDLYVYNGLGGGDGVNIALTGISKVEEYSDRYEVTEKLLYWEWELNQSTNTGYFNIYSYYYTDTNFTGVKLLDKYYDGSTLTFENISVEDVEIKDLYLGNLSEVDTRKVLLSAYYDEATEYKHTFMKNEDGTYYWVKTEIVK